MPSRAQLYFAFAVLAAALAIGGGALYFGNSRTAGSSGQALVGGAFSLTDHTGKRVTDKDYRGKPMLVFFGYTYCPDVCPTELQVMSAALDEMGPRGDAIQPILMTVDPERDTPQVLKSYVSNFHPRLVGLTGSPENVAAAAKAYRVYYKKAPGADAENYLMDHSSIIYLMGTEGEFLKHFTYMTDARQLAKELDAALAR